MRFFGIDLAFGPTNPSGLHVLDERGASVGNSYLYSNQSIVDFVARRADTNGNVLVIDAPLICINETGQRASEKLVGKHYGRFHASCHSSNTNNMAGQRGPRLLAELRGKLPIFVQQNARGASSDMWPVIETYPHPGHIEMFSLSSILKYKKGTANEKRAGLARYMGMLERLQGREPALQVRTVSLFDTDVVHLRGAAMKRQEDLLDALFCAYTALHLWHHREDESRGRVVKEQHSPDFITVPVP